MQIQNRSIDGIAPYGKNAKKHPEKQVLAISNSIEQFGFLQPIVVDKAGVIIVGHGRYSAALLLGLSEVPVLEVDLTEEQARAYRLADNKLNESEWDMALVIEELKSLSMQMLDMTGFDRRLVLESDEKDDEVPPLPTGKPRSELGDLYEMGPHRIICGDSTHPETYLKVMGGGKADMVFTDPPYNINYSGSGKNTSTTILNDKMETAVFQQFLTDTFKHWLDHIKGGAGLYVFHSPTTQREFEEALRVTGFKVKTQLIWNKPTLGLGAGHYRNKHEPFFYASANSADPLFYGDRTHSSVVDFQKTDQQLAAWAKKQREAEKNGKTTIWTMKREPLKDYVHPTQKPVELIMYALANSSKVDDIVLDPFLGSGSTLIACQKTNRTCYGMELDPRFMDVIVQRWVDYTENRNIKKNGEAIVW